MILETVYNSFFLPHSQEDRSLTFTLYH